MRELLCPLSRTTTGLAISSTAQQRLSRDCRSEWRPGSRPSGGEAVAFALPSYLTRHMRLYSASEELSVCFAAVRCALRCVASIMPRSGLRPLCATAAKTSLNTHKRLQRMTDCRSSCTGYTLPARRASETRSCSQTQSRSRSGSREPGRSRGTAENTAQSDASEHETAKINQPWRSLPLRL
jgi:hypothetical protein